MEQTTFLGHYRISVDAKRGLRERGRTVPAITYEATDERSGESFALTLIPVASIDPAAREQFEEQARAAARIKHVNIAKVFDFGSERNYFVYVAEALQGEPLALWIAQHGPMPADAVLRVAEQIVSVLSTARFHKIAHCAIEPSSLMIVPGPTPEGSWPFVKLLNFGLAEFKSSPESSREAESAQLEDIPETNSARGGLSQTNAGDKREESFSVASQFASPEPRKLSGQHQTFDFRSEVYALGATMFFMLTGAAPSPEMPRRSRELSGLPKVLRNLVASMLRRDPDQRPKDPVALAEMIRECLQKIERRQLLARRLGIPRAAVVSRKSKATTAPLVQVLRGILVFAAIVLAAGMLGAFLLPADINPLRRRTAAKQVIGVPIGVPETSSLATPQAVSTPPIVANQPATEPSPGEIQAPSPGSEQEQTSTPGFAAATTPANPPEASPGTTATGSEDSVQAQAHTASASNSSAAESQPAIASKSTSSGKKKSVASKSKSRTGLVGAKMVGITSDGRLIYRLPSGRTRIVAPDSDEDELVPSRRRRDKSRDEFFVPSQPFSPDDVPDY